MIEKIHDTCVICIGTHGMEYEIPKLIVVVVVVVVICGKSRLTNEMKYAIMFMVVDTV